MTDKTTTADVLAAGELIELYGLSVRARHGEWRCDCGRHVGLGKTYVASVIDWAEAARVEVKRPNVVQRWACEVDGAIGAVYTTPENAAVVADIGKCGTVVTCEVVIVETKGV